MQRIAIVLRLFLFLLLVYFVLRVCFGLRYFSSDDLGIGTLLRVTYHGARMDLASLFYISIPFLLFFFFVTPFLPVLWQQRLTLIAFCVTHLPFIALNLVDLVYFKYNLRRSTSDILHSFSGSTHSFGTLFRQYWFLLAVFIFFSFAFVWVVARILRRLERPSRERPYIKWVAALCLFGAFAVLARGWEPRPMIPSTPLLYFHPALQPLVNNSTFNFIYSLKRFSGDIERKDYMRASELDSVFTIRRQYPQENPFSNKNVVIFLLESFGETFFEDGPLRAKTPFFDSIRANSLVCTNAYQNGHESVKGLLAILASIPPFQDEPMAISNYAAVPFRGIGTLLKERGYTTNFFLGAEYDHFNFAKLCRMVGIDNYYSKDTYKHPRDEDDGNWGIYDEFFFPYFGRVSSGMRQPFLSVLFNISSHPPFAIPSARRIELAIPGQDDQRNSISYVDECYRRLFASISSEPWFANTVFVFVADHTLLDNGAKSALYKSLHIPLFIYEPGGHLQGVVTRTAQQMDIVPTVLDYLHYPAPFMSFGNSLLRNGYGYSISKIYGGYQLIDSTTITGVDGASGRAIYHYDWMGDPGLEDNKLSDSMSVAGPAMLIRGILQRFNNSLLDRQLMVK